MSAIQLSNSISPEIISGELNQIVHLEAEHHLSQPHLNVAGSSDQCGPKIPYGRNPDHDSPYYDDSDDFDDFDYAYDVLIGEVNSLLTSEAAK